MKTRAILSALLLSVAASVQAADQTYDWVSTGPGDFTATITLDSSSSAGGSISDVVSGSITVPEGTIPISQADLSDPTGPFTWNSTEITEMNLGIVTFIEGSIYTSYGDTVINGRLYAGHPPGGINVTLGDGLPGDIGVGLNDAGSWLAVPAIPTQGVPDSGNSVWLLGLALAGLGGFRRFRSYLLA